MTALIGYRMFAVDVSTHRIELHGVRQVWKTAEKEARCEYSGLSLAECHASDYAVHRSLSGTADSTPECGIYSFKSLVDCWQQNQWRRGTLGAALAEVENYGEIVVETERGYRAAQTRIHSLTYLPQSDDDPYAIVAVTRGLAGKYGVPVSTSSWHQLLASEPAYIDWLGVQEVEATERMLAGNTPRSDQDREAFSWQISGFQFGYTPASLTHAAIQSPPSWSQLSPNEKQSRRSDPPVADLIIISAGMSVLAYAVIRLATMALS